MTQGVPGDAFKLRRHECGLLDPCIEVVMIGVRIGVLRGEHRGIACNQAVQDRLVLFRQVDRLHTAVLGGGEGNKPGSRSRSAHRKPNCSDVRMPVRSPAGSSWHRGGPPPGTAVPPPQWRDSAAFRRVPWGASRY